MAEETITFELIRKIQMDEQNSSTLTKLPTNFSSAVMNYLEQKRQLASNDDRKSGLEVKTIERLVEDIFNRRERKILNATIISARSGLPPENITEEEKQFYNVIVTQIKNRRNSLLKNLFSSKSDDEKIVVFKEDVEEFVGIDEQTYGPYKKGDTAKLPEENMRLLLDRGIVEPIMK
ncbi:MAG: hypothetical protein HYW22_00280 [Candidatus Aenigmarchaeota archaeon]|nr:hypothetical protein [Candidatus Aenigmarchaeota archaeon]